MILPLRMVLLVLVAMICVHLLIQVAASGSIGGGLSIHYTTVYFSALPTSTSTITSSSSASEVANVHTYNKMTGSEAPAQTLTTSTIAASTTPTLVCSAGFSNQTYTGLIEATINGTAAGSLNNSLVNLVIDQNLVVNAALIGYFSGIAKGTFSGSYMFSNTTYANSTGVQVTNGAWSGAFVGMLNGTYAGNLRGQLISMINGQLNGTVDGLIDGVGSLSTCSNSTAILDSDDYDGVYWDNGGDYTLITLYSGFVTASYQSTVTAVQVLTHMVTQSSTTTVLQQ